MKTTLVLALIILMVLAPPIGDTAAVQEVSASSTPPESERFFVNKEFWAFAGGYVICSFGANSGDYIVLNISSVNIDPDRPDDRYVVDLEISSIKHGVFYVSGTRFRQTIPLNYSDSYTITADKHQFWSSVRINGDITIYHNSLTSVTDSPLQSSTPVPTLSPIPNPSKSPNSNVSPTPIVPELSWLIILPLFLFTLFIAVLVKSRRASKRLSNT